MATVLTPSARSQRARLTRLGLLFFLAALPVAAVLGFLLNWWIATGYVVVQTGGLLFAAGQQRTSTLRVDDDGLRYEAPTFALHVRWADVDRLGRATLPTGDTLAFVLDRSTITWTRSAGTRHQLKTRGWDRVVPIDEFAPRWPTGPLADAVRRNRPDLLVGR